MVVMPLATTDLRGDIIIGYNTYTPCLIHNPFAVPALRYSPGCIVVDHEVGFIFFMLTRRMVEYFELKIIFIAELRETPLYFGRVRALRMETPVRSFLYI